MKNIVIALTLFSALVLAGAAAADTYNLAALKAEAARAVPGAKVIASGADDDSAFVGMQADGLNYQFTLSADQTPQAPDAESLTYDGRAAYFFEPGMPGSGALMIMLTDCRSLTILCASGFDSDREITAADLTAVADRMRLDAL